jgi:hypothetical protein
MCKCVLKRKQGKSRKNINSREVTEAIGAYATIARTKETIVA